MPDDVKLVFARLKDVSINRHLVTLERAAFGAGSGAGFGRGNGNGNGQGLGRGRGNGNGNGNGVGRGNGTVVQMGRARVGQVKESAFLGRPIVQKP